MPKTVAQFIEENINDLRKLQKIGVISCTLINNYSVYSYFKSLNPKTMPSKMDRYQFTADSMRVNERVVRRVIKEMERAMN